MGPEAGGSNAGAKPVDVGNGSLAASFGRATGALLSLLVPHPRHGTVELSAAPPFDERHRGDPAETRRHRARLTDDRFACLRLERVDGGPFVAANVDLADPLCPVWRGFIGELRVRASSAADAAGIAMAWEAEAGPLPPLRLRFEGRLDRPALAEITETDPPAPSGATTVLRAEGPRLLVASPELGASITIDAGSGTWSVVGSGAVLDVAPRRSGGGGTIAAVRCTSELAIAPRAMADPAGAPEPPIGDAMRPIVWRALAYVRSCTALATSPDERVILADHRILPLSWTRDAYFGALLLLARDGAGDRRRVADHLRWLWRRCDRPDGRWVRSHHGDGRRKDLAFQADQQLYPILELADFWRRCGTLPDGVEWSRAVSRAWSAALGEVDPTTGLLACAENAADDPAAEPFLASSQVVLWYATRRLAEMARAGALSLEEGALEQVAERTRQAFGRSLIGEGRWAYAGNGAGRHVEYHDANDLPTALAPLWGFCPADDPAWLATMDWAFAPANPGYFAGDRGGLGSRHTPGAWTLGDVQRWLVARTVGDEEDGRVALARLRDVAFDDGMLPEAYSARGPDIRVRHWFAWPGAAIGAFLVLDARNELESFLRA
jgi:hypothetical protein